MPETDAFQLPGRSAQFLPQELDEAFFMNIDQRLQREEQKQMERTLEDLNRRGFLRSGETLKQVSENVLGPGSERRAGVLLPLARETAQEELGFRRERQVAGETFERQKEFQRIDFLNRIELVREQAKFQRELMQLQEDLEGGGGFGEIFGQAAGIGLGSLFGGVGAGIGGSVGGYFGRKFGGGGGGSTRSGGGLI